MGVLNMPVGDEKVASWATSFSSASGIRILLVGVQLMSETDQSALPCSRRGGGAPGGRRSDGGDHSPERGGGWCAGAARPQLSAGPFQRRGGGGRGTRAAEDLVRRAASSRAAAWEQTCVWRCALACWGSV
jgi:hypothetical protein